MPNLFAYAMLFIWPLIMIGLFKSTTPDRALIWSFLGAYMFVPTGVFIDFPLIPTLDKFTIPSLTALLLCLTTVKQRIRLFPSSTLASIFMICFVLSPFATLINNRDPVVDGVVFMPGLSMRDAISVSLTYVIQLIPFILAFNLLSTRQARHNFLTAYMIAGLIYSIPILLEIRLAPQLNYWFYGFFPELFAQQIRFGGFRPVVFMGHGLTVAFFAMTAVMATAILFRASTAKARILHAYAMVYLLIVLVMCKTVGALVLAAMFLPIMLFTNLRIKSWVIFICALFVLTYPALRSDDLIPADKLISYAALIQEERAQSLEFRFENEKMLLDHAAKKPLFGWGFWDRNRLWDPETGRGLTVTDGYWIIILGVLGWTGYISVFGLLTLPLFRLWWRQRFPGAADEHYLTYGTSLLLAVNLLDLIPNSTINTMTWLLTGLLLASSLQIGKDKTKEPVSEDEFDNGYRTPLHTRQHSGKRPYSRTPLDYSRGKKRSRDV